MTEAEGVADRPHIVVFTRSWRSAGAGLFAQSLVDGLVQEGAKVTFVCPRVESDAFEAPRAELRRIRPPRERGKGAARPLRIAASLGRMAGGALGLLRARLTARTFIISIPDPLVFAVPVLALLRLTGARIIFVAHDPLPHAWVLPPWLRRLEIATHGACYRLASAVVVLSEPSKDELHRAFPDPRRAVHVIDHGVFAMGAPVPLPGEGRLLAFGTIRRNKGVVEAIQGVIAAAAEGVPVTLTVAGGEHRDDRGYCDECRAVAAGSEAVEMRVGYVSDEDLERLLARSDALLMPYTDFHSQSGVAILAASNARPVIATPAGGIGTLLAEGMPGIPIAQPASTAAVADAVRAFFEVPAQEWRTRAMAYREVMLERRSWPAIARHYLELARALRS